MSDDDPLKGLAWNQATIEPGDGSLDRGLLTIFAHDLHEQPHVVGTGFVVLGGRTAIAVTAAHNFTAIHDLQTPRRHHRTALEEFRPPRPQLDIGALRVRAVGYERGLVEACTVDGVVFDRYADVAAMCLSTQTPDTSDYFASEYLFDDRLPVIGDLVCALAYRHEPITSVVGTRAPTQEFQMRRKPVLRIGRVTAHYLQGHYLCRGPCIETSIPVFAGMSGGPVLRYEPGGRMSAFGVICADSERSETEAHDRSTPGSSLVARLPVEVILGSDGKRHVTLEFRQGEAVGLKFPGSPGTTTPSPLEAVRTSWG